MGRRWRIGEGVAARTERLAIRIAGLVAAIVPLGCGDGPPVVDDCNKAYYGPPPCKTDEECAAKPDAGPNWYCDKAYLIDPQCRVTWPTCRPRD